MSLRQSTLSVTVLLPSIAHHHRPHNITNAYQRPSVYHLMLAEAQSRHAIGAFIQEVAHGALIRHWLALAEVPRREAINHFVRHASVQEQTEMAHSLLQVAATYPDCAVRRQLIGVYALFRIANDSAQPYD